MTYDLPVAVCTAPGKSQLKSVNEEEDIRATAHVPDDPEPIAVSSAQRITSKHHFILFVEVREMNPNNKEYFAKPLAI